MAVGKRRLLLWLGACAALLAAFRPSCAMLAGDKPMRRAWNFAFGSNMDKFTRMRRQLQPTQKLPAVADGWELWFSLAGVPFLEPSFATLRPSQNISTHGVCLELGRESWIRLLVSEGVFGAADINEFRMRQVPLEEILDRAAKRGQAVRGYRLLPIEVSMYSTSQRETAYALVDGDFESETEMPQVRPPSLRYWRLLRNGARRHGLTRDYRDYLASLPRYVPSLLAPAALPALAGAAAARWVDSSDQEAWPRLQGPASLALGRLEIGPDPPADVWSKFCSVPRDELLNRVMKLVGEESTTLYLA
ncbi:aclK [Symbiodinium sp. CCMP2456]|nr:aclK [Symbiodinium sp. CCMP2456]